MVSTAAGTLAVARAALAAAAPLRGLLVLNSRHLAPRTIIILDTAILGFLAAMRGLERRRGSTCGLVCTSPELDNPLHVDTTDNKNSFLLRSIFVPDKLTEGLVVGESAVVLLREDVVDVLHAPVVQQL